MCTQSLADLHNHQVCQTATSYQSSEQQPFLHLLQLPLGGNRKPRTTTDPIIPPAANPVRKRKPSPFATGTKVASAAVEGLGVMATSTPQAAAAFAAASAVAGPGSGDVDGDVPSDASPIPGVSELQICLYLLALLNATHLLVRLNATHLVLLLNATHLVVCLNAKHLVVCLNATCLLYRGFIVSYLSLNRVSFCCYSVTVLLPVFLVAESLLFAH